MLAHRNWIFVNIHPILAFRSFIKITTSPELRGIAHRKHPYLVYRKFPLVVQKGGINMLKWGSQVKELNTTTSFAGGQIVARVGMDTVRQIIWQSETIIRKKVKLKPAFTGEHKLKPYP